MTADTYTCPRCHTTVGIAGSAMDEDDYDADDYYDREVERHESGECTPEPNRLSVSIHLRAGRYNPTLLYSMGAAFVSFRLAGDAILYGRSAAAFERLAQAALDAANLLREADDPPVVVARTEPLASPFAAEVSS